MGQHNPNYSPSGHQPTDIGNSLIDNVSSILSPYSGLLADGHLQTKVSDFQHDPALSHAVLSRSLLLESSHASYNAYKNDTSDEILTSHAENFTRSHKNTPIDIEFTSGHSSISHIDHTEESYLLQAPNPVCPHMYYPTCTTRTFSLL